MLFKWFFRGFMKLYFLIGLFVQLMLYSSTELKLSDNTSVKGEIIKENSSYYIVDLGFTVLSVPTDKVIEKIEAKDVIKKQTITESKIYHQNIDLKKKSIKEHVLTLGNSVVIVNTPSGLGSGFIINKDGYLITNYHVIDKEKNIKITMFVKKNNDFEKVVYSKVKIVSFNPFLDLALLKIEEGGDFPFVYLGNIEEVKAGDTSFAIGNPLGLERSVSQGIISSTDRNYQGVLYIQTTTPINPGNSGGPLFNLKGEVIGVTNMGYMFTDGLGFAIPVDSVIYFLEHKEAFYYNEHNYNTGFRYLEPPKLKKDKK